VTGGIVGAVCGAVAVAIIAAAEGGIGALISNDGIRIVGFAAGAGAVAGMIGAPALAWGVLRRVPLGRAVVVTALGTVIGAILGEFLNPLNSHARIVPGVIAGAFGGFIAAGVALRIATRRRATSSSVTGGE
jgi:hypothetical protein